MPILGPDGRELHTPTEEADGLRIALREATQDRRTAERNAELFAYELLSYMGSARETDLAYRDRLKIVKQARDIWKKDAQAGASVRLFNDFVFGRGVPRPKMHDETVQTVVDKAWDDPQNQRVLTSSGAQRALGVDLAIQSNLFFLLFVSDDGTVKVSLLPHDEVEDVVRDEENRHRILYVKVSRRKYRWDFATDREVASGEAKVEYFPVWGNIEEAKEEGVEVPEPPSGKLGAGEVFHVAINRTSESAFGHPEMHRVIGWYAAFKEFMANRVDLTKAQAAIWMKRKVKGGESSVLRMAQQQLTRRSDLAGTDGGAAQMPARAAGILVENESATHEPFSFNTNAGNAAQDADMLHGQMAAATGWPKHYTGGDAGALAGATALELPVLKLVESRQEVFEEVYRWFIDRVVEQAVKAKVISRSLKPEELREGARAQRGRRLLAIAAEVEDERQRKELERRAVRLIEAHEDRATDEAETERDLGYEFSMPNPLRRSMGDVMQVISTAAKTFDPNGTNLELTKLLFGLTLSEVLEVENPGELVKTVFPDDYVDPLMAAQGFGPGGQPPGPGGGGPPGGPPELAPPGAPPGTFGSGGGAPGSVGADGQRHRESNPYGAPRQSRPPEEMREGRYEDLPGGVRAAAESRADEATEEFLGSVWDVLERALGAAYGNGNGNGKGQ